MDTDSDTNADDLIGWVPVPVAASKLGIHEKRLRRLLRKEPSDETGTRMQTRTLPTRSGPRDTLVLSPSFVSELAARLAEPIQDVDVDIDTDAPKPTAVARTRTPPLNVDRVSRVYERMLTEKDARISEQAKELERATTREREAAAREQARVDALEADKADLKAQRDQLAAELARMKEDAAKSLQDARTVATEQRHGGLLGWLGMGKRGG